MRRFMLLALLIVGALLGVAVAQDVDPLQPATWFTSAEAVTVIGTWLAAQVVRLTTALGKDWFKIDGPRTKTMAMVISVVIGGVGGYLSLGFLSDLSGIQGAIYAAVMMVGSFLGATSKAEYDRQVQASGAERAAARAKVKLQ